CWGRSGEALIKIQVSPSAAAARLACVSGRTRASPAHARWHGGQRQVHCGKPPPPPSQGRGRAIAPLTTGANGPDQNSAGKYPLISRPTQISTRVGIVQAIGRLP